MSSRSSPLLTTPRSPCPDGPSEPFSDGAEIQVANLDYRMSRKDLQQTLHDTFSRYGQASSSVEVRFLIKLQKKTQLNKDVIFQEKYKTHSVLK